MGFGIEDLKRWHWVVIGLLVGLLLGYVQTEVGGGEYAEAPSTMSPHTFERYLGEMARGANVKGHARIGGVRVYPNGSGYTVTVARLEPTNGTELTATVWKDRLYTWVAPKEGYKPVWTDGGGVDIEVRPAARWNGPVELLGWTSGDGRLWRDPGEVGSEVRVALEPGNYRLAVELEPAQRVKAKKATPPPAALRAAWDAAGVTSKSSTSQPATGPATQPVPRGERLAVTVNGRRLAPLRRDPKPGPSLWYADVPADALVAGEGQVFRFARTGEAVPVKRIRIYDPDYTVVSFLKDLSKREKKVKFRYAWWAEPRMRMGLWTLAGGVLIGGVWPSVVRLLVGAGYARPPRVKEKKYDLNRFYSGPEPAKKPVPTGPGLDVAHLEELEEELLAGLEAEAAARAEEPAAGSEPVRQLETDDPADAPAPAGEDEDKEYVGEFYPVARPHVHHHDGPEHEQPSPPSGGGAAG